MEAQLVCDCHRETAYGVCIIVELRIEYPVEENQLAEANIVQTPSKKLL